MQQFYRHTMLAYCVKKVVPAHDQAESKLPYQIDSDPSSFEFPTGLNTVSFTKSLKDLRCQHEKAEIQEIANLPVTLLTLDKLLLKEA